MIDHNIVALASSAFAKGAFVAQAHAASILGDWDPKDHPRDPNSGEFIALGKGIYLFGQTKKAKTSGSKASAPTFEVDLEPGSTLNLTSKGNHLVVKADGTGVFYNPKGTSSVKVTAAQISLLTDSGPLKVLDENPATVVPAKSLSEAEDKIEHPSVYDEDASTSQFEFTFNGVTHSLGSGDVARKHNKNMIIVRANGDHEYWTSEGVRWYPLMDNGSDVEGNNEWLSNWISKSNITAVYGIYAEGPKAQAPETEKPAQTDAKGVSADSQYVSEGMFTHPVEPTAQMVVPTDATIYKHKKFESFIVSQPGQTPIFFNQKGKFQKKNGDYLSPPKDTLGLLSSNYDIVHSPGEAKAPEPEKENLDSGELADWEKELLGPGSDAVTLGQQKDQEEIDNAPIGSIVKVTDLSKEVPLILGIFTKNEYAGWDNILNKEGAYITDLLGNGYEIDLQEPKDSEASKKVTQADIDGWADELFGAPIGTHVEVTHPTLGIFDYYKVSETGAQWKDSAGSWDDPYENWIDDSKVGETYSLKVTKPSETAPTSDEPIVKTDVSKQDLKDATKGAVLTLVAKEGSVYTYKKNGDDPDHSWTDKDGDTTYPTTFISAFPSYDVTLTVPPKSEEEPTYPEPAVSKEEVVNAPVGAKLTVEGGLFGTVVYTKNSDTEGDWSTEYGIADPVEFYSASPKVLSEKKFSLELPEPVVEKTTPTDFTEMNALGITEAILKALPGDKVLMKDKDSGLESVFTFKGKDAWLESGVLYTDTDVYGVPASTGDDTYTYGYAPGYASQGAAQIKSAEAAASGPNFPNDNFSVQGTHDKIAAFTHPVSGYVVDIPEGYSLYQHKKSPNSYMLAAKDGVLEVFLDKNGTPKNPPAHVAKTFPGNWNSLYVGEDLNVPEPEPVKVEATDSALLKPKKKVSSKKKQKALPAKPKQHPEEWTYSLPFGVSIDLHAGESLYKFVSKNDGDDVYVVFSPGNISTAWRKSGASVKVNIKTAEHMEERIAAGTTNGEMLLKRPPGTYSPDDFEAPNLPEQTTAAAMAFQTSMNLSFGQAQGLTPSIYGGFQQNSSITFEVDGEQVNWGSITPQQTVNLLASLDEPAASAETALTAISKWPTGSIPTSTKTALGKDRKRYEFVRRMAAFAQEVNNYENSEWTDDQFNAEFLELQTKVNNEGKTFGKNFPFRGQQYLAAVQSVIQEKKFTKSVQGLGFDPLSPTTEDIDTYAKSKDFPLIHLLSSEHQKSWLLDSLGYPNLDYYAKMHMLKAVKTAQQSYSLGQFMASLNTPSAKADDADPIPEAQKHHGLGDILALSYKYEFKDSSALVHVSPDVWRFWHADGQTTEDLTDNAALLMVKENDENIVNSSTLKAYGAHSAQEHLSTLLEVEGAEEFDQQTANLLLKNAGAQYVGKMDYATKWQWMRYHLAGDVVGKYAIEQMAVDMSSVSAHKKSGVHPGSWESPEGQAALKAQAEWLAGFPWGKTVLDGKSLTLTQQKQAFSDLQLTTTDVDDWGGEPSDIEIAAEVNEWVVYHLRPEQREVMSAHLATLGADFHTIKKHIPKPAGTSQEDWTAALALTDGTDVSEFVGSDIMALSEEFINAGITSSSDLTYLGVNTLNLGGVPLSVRRTLYKMAKEDSTIYAGLMQALTHLIKEGHFLDAETPVWIAPNGSHVPLSPGFKVWKHKTYDNNFLITPPANDSGQYAQGIQFNPDYPQGKTLAGYTVNSWTGDGGAYAQVFTMPGILTKAESLNAVPSATSDDWDMLELLEAGDPKGKVYKSSLQGADLSYEILHETLPALEKDGSDDSLTVAANLLDLPEAIQQHIYSHGAKPSYIPLLAHKISSGHYATGMSKPLFDSQGPYIQYISKGLFSKDDIKQHWSSDAVKSYVAEFGLGGASEVPGHLAKSLGLADAPKSSLGILPTDLILTKVNKSLGGMHSKTVHLDQNKNEWMAKGFPSDPNGAARVDAEHIANVIGRSMGFRQPVTKTLVVDGQYSYLQHLAPATGSLMNLSPADLTQEQLQQAMEEHVLDWLVSNHDSHGDNLLTSPDGTVFGIDKGQAFRFFPDDKLAYGYKATNPVPVWYDRFYEGLINGSISKEQADLVTTAVLRKALRARKRDDDAYRAHLEEAFKSRKQFPNGMSKDDFIAAVMERKANVFDDFTKFYKSLYKSSPYDFDIDTEALQKSKLDDHTHVSISQELADEVKVSGSHGKALMLNSADVEEAHVMLSTRIDKGVLALTGEMKLRKDADTVLVNWLQQQTISGGQLKGTTQAPVPTGPTPSILPHVANWFSTVKAAAVSVNFHSPDGGKSPDGEYSVAKLDSMDNAKTQITKMLNALNAWESKEPVKPFSGTLAGIGVTELATAEQQAAFKGALEQLLTDIQSVTDAKNAGIKVKPHVSEPSYTMTYGLNVDGNPQPVKVFTSGSYTYTKYDDGGWTSTLGDSTIKATSADFNIWAANNTVTEVDAPKAGNLDEDDAEDETVQITVGVTPVSVTKKKFEIRQSDLDTKTGNIVSDGSYAVPTSNQNTAGYMYEIDFGGTSIQYMPWGAIGVNQSDDGVPRSHQGMLRFERLDWNGDAKAIEDVFEVIKGMGLDFPQADEDSLELYYWRHMIGILQARADGKTKYKATLAAIQKAWAANPDMQPTEELKALREAWAASIGQDKVEKANWMPQFSRNNVHSAKDNSSNTSGRPYWLHPEANYADLHKGWNGKTPRSSLHHSGDALKIALSGAAMSTEERTRVLGRFKQGTSSDDDMYHGSANYVFTRQNSNGGEMYYHPRVGLRTTNYAYSGDNYGEMDNKKNSYFDLLQSSSISGGGNELMIKNTTSVLDDVIAIVMGSESDRDKALKFYKERGITEINNIPIEKVFTTDHYVAAASVSEVWKQILKDEKAAA